MTQRIAIPTNEGKLWQHFGKAPQVTIFDIEDGKIIDYHCHLIPQMVAENKRFESIAQIWLMGDHYKW